MGFMQINGIREKYLSAVMAKCETPYVVVFTKCFSASRTGYTDYIIPLPVSRPPCLKIFSMVTIAPLVVGF